ADAGADFDDFGDDFGDGFGDGFEADEFDGGTEAMADGLAQVFMGVTQDAVAPVAQALDEARQEFDSFRQEVGYERLVNELPELADPDVAEGAITYAHK